MAFLPSNCADLTNAGLKPGDLDVVIVTGDAYVDHSSFGVAILGRLLEAEGYRTGILARPDPDDVEAFRLLGRPRLAFLVTAGAVDSMVSSYTANKKPRSEDDYAPGGDKSLCLRRDGIIGKGTESRANARPDRAVIHYTTMCRQAYKGSRIVIGGIEASLRRHAHYDYWSNKVRKSILLDSKADVLVYGMGETQIKEIMRRLKTDGENADLTGIRGTAWAKFIGSSTAASLANEFEDALLLPDFGTMAGADSASKLNFQTSFLLQYNNTDPYSAKRLIEPYGDRVVVQEAPALPLARRELDAIYALPYQRRAHPMYEAFGGVPALAEVKFSLLSSRGCFGACSFCALSFHQGRQVNSRSVEAIVNEARILTRMGDFKGYIHDVGGPTANFRVSACKKMDKKGACLDRRCLAPEPCPALEVDHGEYLRLLRELRAIPGVKKVFVRSGVRFDYAMLDKSDEFLRELVEHHISGQLKVAPEHVSDKVLALMGKPPRHSYDEFATRYASLNREKGLKQYLVPYFISAHPGSGLKEAIELAEYLRDTGFIPEQAQDFYPTPGTLATAMYWCEANPLDGKPVYVAKGAHERAMQRALLQYSAPANADLVREALIAVGRSDLIGTAEHCLVRPGGRSANRGTGLSRRRN
jgi:uncharacterized radical SAM protein YgiQ